MISMVVGDQGALVECADGPVVPDGGGHGQQALRGAGVDAEVAAGAVFFQ
jgi:hypothetical protein